METGGLSLGLSSAPGRQERVSFSGAEHIAPEFRTTSWGLHMKGFSGDYAFWPSQLSAPNHAWLFLHRCWDINANVSVWWVIRGPVILSILVSGCPSLSWIPGEEMEQ